jgi:hypothetical protein
MVKKRPALWRAFPLILLQVATNTSIGYLSQFADSLSSQLPSANAATCWHTESAATLAVSPGSAHGLLFDTQKCMIFGTRLILKDAILRVNNDFQYVGCNSLVCHTFWLLSITSFSCN